MPQIIYTENAQRDLQRFLDFMDTVAPQVKDKMIDTIVESIAQLALFPELGKPVENTRLRELIIPFGRSAYVVLYQFHQPTQVVRIAALRHGREAGYKLNEMP